MIMGRVVNLRWLYFRVRKKDYRTGPAPSQGSTRVSRICSRAVLAAGAYIGGALVDARRSGVRRVESEAALRYVATRQPFTTKEGVIVMCSDCGIINPISDE